MRGLLLTLISCFSATVAAQGQRQAALVNLTPEDIPSTTMRAINSDTAVSGVAILGSSAAKDGLASALPAAQDDYIATGKKRLEQATTSYEKFNLDDALKHLKAVDDAVGGHPENREARNILAKRYLLSGVVHFDKEAKDLAERDFRVANRLDRQLIQLDTAKYRPAVVTLYQQAVAQNRNASKTPVSISVEPPTATVRLDGHSVRDGTSVGTGPHLAWFVETGYEAHFEVVEITSAANLLAHNMKPFEKSRRLIELRHRLVASTDNTDLLADIASLVGAELLIVLQRGPAGVQASVYHAKTKVSVAATTPGTEEFRVALSELGGNPGGPGVPAVGWYETWWGRTLMVTAGAAIITTAMVFLITSGTESDEFMIGGWCTRDDNC